MSFEQREIEELSRAFERVFKGLQSFKKEIRTDRELLFLRIGLRAAHLEESIVQGDEARAKAHASSLLRLISKL